MFRELADSMDSSVVARIDERLAEVRRDQNVAIPLAVESGSRAWGFPSPDSDYDCRFIYIRPPEDYLALWAKRDVIETPLDPILDVNGWDLGKALKLLLKGNATVVEWLTSPISYRTNQAFRADLLELAHNVTDRRLIGRHYLHLGERQRKTYFHDGKPIAQKKIFYALRPAASLRWLRLHPEATVPPMNLPTLLAECDPPLDVRDIAVDLIAKKAVTHELGTMLLPDPVASFLDAEFKAAALVFEKSRATVSAESRLRCNAFFLSALERQAILDLDDEPVVRTDN